MGSDENQPEPTPTTDDVTAQIERTCAELVAAITAGHQKADEAMKAAEDAVAQAVQGASKAVLLAQQAVKKPDA